MSYIFFFYLQKTNIAGLPRSVDQNSGRRRRSSERDILRADNQELEVFFSSCESLYVSSF